MTFAFGGDTGGFARRPDIRGAIAEASESGLMLFGEDAVGMVLRYVGVTRGQIEGLETDLEHARGRWVWDITFTVEGSIHEFLVDAYTGDIFMPLVRLTEDEALEIALRYVGRTLDELEVVDVHIDFEMGRLVWEVYLVIGGENHEVYIDLYTGHIVHHGTPAFF